MHKATHKEKYVPEKIVARKEEEKEAQQEDAAPPKVTSKLSPFPYLAAYILPILAVTGIYLGGYYPLIFSILVYLVLSSIELVAGVDGYNPSKEESKYLETKFSFRFITYLWVPVQIFVALYSTLTVAQNWDSYNFIQLIGAFLMVGSSTGGTGITVAHELIHKQNPFEQNLGKIVLHFVTYTHFYIEHIHGHHKRVATKNDPATSQFGEDVYPFIFKSAYGGYMSAWELEAKRLRKNNQSIFSPIHNQMIHYTLATIVTCAIFYLINGLPAVVFFLGQSFFGFMLLEVVNYIEHYGLQRKEIGSKGSNIYERVSPLHSWNSDHRISNYFLFKLQRHADHHTWPTRRYQTLRSWDFSPQLPVGYVGMIIVALIPPLFHSIMDPKVIQYNAIMYGGNPDDDAAENRD